MKTGFDNLISNITNEDIPDGLIIKIQSILYTLITKAIETASIYSKSAKRKNISSTDLLYALQYQAHEFFNDNDGDFYDMCCENEQYILNNESYSEETDSCSTNSEQESDSETDETESSENITEDDEIFTRAEDDENEMISKINNYHDDWQNWEPTDHIQQIIKKSINHHFSV